ncbi:nucleoside monophosphate kinase [Candidatus Dependentiae bacterium]|nr:MAG: nucleoside monophosphate kinase [Candidatus Dependentiae bacterium]
MNLIQQLDKIYLMIVTATLTILGSYFYLSQKQTDPHTKTIFILMGAPGSGKGTLAEQCVKTLGFTTLSTGNLLREAVTRKDDLGKQAESYMKKGELVPDDLVTSIVANWLSKNLSDIDTLILDGYPRTVQQAQLFIELLKNRFPNVSLHVVELTASDDVIVHRLANRLICEKCQTLYSRKLLKDPEKLICESCGSKLIQREDDKEKVVRKRLKVYAEHAHPLRNFYQTMGIQIDQLNTEDEQILEGFKKLLEEIITRKSQNTTSGT